MDPFGDGCIDLGDGHLWRWMQDGNAIWRHPKCRSWCHVDLASGDYHRIVKGAHGDVDGFSIEASLLCPIGCGTHGYIRNGRWVSV